MIYRLLFAIALRRLDAEAAHRLGIRALGAACAIPGVQALLRRRLAAPDPVLAVRALGLTFASPLGLAAGFDKDGEHTAALAALGFGFVEAGTVTSAAQPGTPRPRLFRLTADRALINRMGFNNAGAAALAARLARPRAGIVGVNIGRLRTVGGDGAAADYAVCAARVAAVADYLVLNVSSPNTPGLRDLQATSELRDIVGAVRGALAAAGRELPLLVKIAPDLADDDIDAIADLALELRLDGIIAVNTTTAREPLLSDPHVVAAAGDGGLSGPPLARRSLAVLARLRARAGDQIVLVSVGGVTDADDAWERIRAGATLVQAYTAFVYGGPLWPARVCRELAARCRTAGLETVAQAVGAGAVRACAVSARSDPRPSPR